MELNDLFSPKHLSNWKEIGSGQLGIVYKVDCDDGNIYAVKEVSCSKFNPREYEVAMSLQNKSSFLINFYEKRDYKEKVYILMEYANGGMLSNVLEDEQPCGMSERTIKFIFQLILGIYELHRRNFTHRYVIFLLFMVC
jgi:serine/threonine protein kinase